MPAHRMSPSAREGVVSALAKALAVEPDVGFAYLHGSFLIDAPFRDIDVAAFFAAGTPHPAERAVALADRLSALVRMPVDVRALNDAPVTFRFHALRGRLLCVRDEALLADVLETTMRGYFDLEPILRDATREAFAR